jgi:hypothetical protein
MNRRAWIASYLALAVAWPLPMAALGQAAPSALDCQAIAELPANFGDFEILADPQDPNGHLLLTANIGEGDQPPNPIVLVRLDGHSGVPLTNARIIATDYVGFNLVNGPEPIFHPAQGLGLLYQGPGGVHGVWRGTAAWDDFSLDEFGTPISGNPPPLTASFVGLAPANPHPQDSAMLVQKSADSPTSDPLLCVAGCAGRCYSHPGDTTATALAEALAPLGLDVGRSRPHPLDQSGLFFAGCDETNPERCAIYQLSIDRLGGVLADSLRQVTPAAPHYQRASFEAAIHPLTEKLVLFVLSEAQLEIWQAEGDTLALVATTTELPDQPGHARVVATDTALVFHFIDRRGADSGSYLVRFRRQPRPPERISERGSGEELVYLPAAKRLALFAKTGKDHLMRCWLAD